MASVIAVYGRRNFNPVLNLAVLQQPEHGKPPADAAPHPEKKGQDRRCMARIVQAAPWSGSWVWQASTLYFSL